MNKINLLKNLNGIALFFIILFFIFGKVWLLFISVVLLLISLFGGNFSYAIAEFWFKFSQLIGTVLSKILLTIVFFLLLTPLAFLYRIFKREVYLFFRDKRRESFFKDVNIEYKKEDFEKMW